MARKSKVPNIPSTLITKPRQVREIPSFDEVNKTRDMMREAINNGEHGAQIMGESNDPTE